MPAVTVDDITVLPRVKAPDVGLVTARPVASVTSAPRGFEGEGFPVRRAFAGVDASLLDPFIMMDQMGEVEYAPGEPKGTSWHPHRGFETVTYIMDGAFIHQDSHGGGGVITNGDTQWMTAGSGLLHIETPPESLVMNGGLFHGLQLWVNLPSNAKMNKPRYQDLRANGVTLLSSSDGGALLRVIAGDLDVHADDDGARDHQRWGIDDHPVAPRLQRVGLRPRRSRHGGCGEASGPHRTAHGVRQRRQHHDLSRREPGRQRARTRRRTPRRSADPRADRVDGAVRHEHPARAAAGHRGLPRRPPRHRTRRRNPTSPPLTPHPFPGECALNCARSSFGAPCHPQARQIPPLE